LKVFEQFLPADLELMIVFAQLPILVSQLSQLQAKLLSQLVHLEGWEKD
jgi:hypothetical protein